MEKRKTEIRKEKKCRQRGFAFLENISQLIL